MRDMPGKTFVYAEDRGDTAINKERVSDEIVKVRGDNNPMLCVGKNPSEDGIAEARFPACEVRFELAQAGVPFATEGRLINVSIKLCAICVAKVGDLQRRLVCPILNLLLAIRFLLAQAGKP